MGDTERWHLDHDGHDHVVEVAQGALTREVVWTRGGAELGRKKTSDETIVLAPKGEDAALRLKFGMVGPARRVTLHDSETEAHTGLGGTDFEPEAGSRAARRAEWIGAHPHLHTARQTAVAAAGVGVPVLVVWLLTLVPWPAVDIPWPDVDLPSIPWPDLPSIPLARHQPAVDPVARPPRPAGVGGHGAEVPGPDPHRVLHRPRRGQAPAQGGGEAEDPAVRSRHARSSLLNQRVARS